MELDKGKSRFTYRNAMSNIVFVSKHVLLKQQNRLHFTLDTYRIIQRDEKRYIENDDSKKKSE